MKIFKYIAIIAVSILACTAFAQSNKSAKQANKAPAAAKADNKNASNANKNGNKEAVEEEEDVVEIKINNVKGNPVVNIILKPSKKSNSSVTVAQALDKAVSKVMQQMNPDSVTAKAVVTSLLSVKNSLLQPTSPLSNTKHIQVKVENRVEGVNNIATANTSVSVGSVKYEAKTETTLNTETKVTQTSGNVSATANNGATTVVPVKIEVSASGEVSGSVGDTVVSGNVTATPAPDAGTTEQQPAQQPAQSESETETEGEGEGETTTQPEQSETTQPEQSETTQPEQSETTQPDQSETTTPDTDTDTPDQSETVSPTTPTNPDQGSTDVVPDNTVVGSGER